MSTLGRPPVILDIVEEHFDELDWLWEHRNANVFTRDWHLSDLAEIEARAEAHLDGLRLAEQHGVELAVDRLGDGESATAAATMVLFDTKIASIQAQIWEAFRSADPDVVDGIRVALRHCTVGDAAEVLLEIAASPDHFRAVAALDLLAFHRLQLPDGGAFAEEGEPETLALAIGALGRGRPDDASLIRALDHESPWVRWSGIASAARAGTAGLLERCRELAQSTEPVSHEAIAGVGMLGEEADVALLTSLVERPDTARAAVAALGATGFVSAVPTLLDLMSDEELGEEATLAYRRITGATDVEGEKPLPESTADDDDEDDDASEALPPDPQKAKADWRGREPSMAASQRWHWGVAFPDDRPPALNAVPLESRRDVYLRLRSRFGQRLGDLELEAMVPRQLREGRSLAGQGA